MKEIQVNPKLHSEWLQLLESEFQQDYFAQIKSFLLNEKASAQVVYPPSSQIFAALDLCPPSQVRVVILGQDPYHGPGQAHGLSFSVPEGIPFPPSLQNIFKEIQADLGGQIPKSGDLTHWAEQGVLLLNTSLSVRAHQAASHSKIGWERFSDAIIQKLNDSQTPIVFMLWGNHARSKKVLINNPRHLLLEAPHPSPLSAHRGFMGCGHFGRCNEFLIQHGYRSIDWLK